MKDIFDKKNIEPMLMYETQPFDDDNYIYELKLDGIRCLAYLDKESVNLRNKRDKDVTFLYPELSNLNLCIKEKCILDGELVIFKDGKPDFYSLQRRSLMGDRFRIKLASKRNEVEFVAYDILYFKDSLITDKELTERKKILSNNITEGYGLSVSRFVEGRGIDFFNLAKEHGLEGIVAKNKNGKYHIGKRTRDWVKIKVMQEEDLIICGYQRDEDGAPKDIILGEMSGKNLVYRGKIYLGVSKEEIKKLLKFSVNNTTSPHFELSGDIVWLKPELTGTVKYMHKTDNGGMRHPIWKGIKE